MVGGIFQRETTRFSCDLTAGPQDFLVVGWDISLRDHKTFLRWGGIFDHETTRFSCVKVGYLTTRPQYYLLVGWDI